MYIYVDIYLCIHTYNYMYAHSQTIYCIYVSIFTSIYHISMSICNYIFIWSCCMSTNTTHTQKDALAHAHAHTHTHTHTVLIKQTEHLWPTTKHPTQHTTQYISKKIRSDVATPTPQDRPLSWGPALCPAAGPTLCPAAGPATVLLVPPSVLLAPPSVLLLAPPSVLGPRPMSCYGAPPMALCRPPQQWQATPQR